MARKRSLRASEGKAAGSSLELPRLLENSSTPRGAIAGTVAKRERVTGQGCHLAHRGEDPAAGSKMPVPKEVR